MHHRKVIKMEFTTFPFSTKETRHHVLLLTLLLVYLSLNRKLMVARQLLILFYVHFCVHLINFPLQILLENGRRGSNLLKIGLCILPVIGIHNFTDVIDQAELPCVLLVDFLQ
jgi:hypothetical protein